VIAVALLSGAVALATILTPSGDVNAKRQAAETDIPEADTAAETPEETAALEVAVEAAATVDDLVAPEPTSVLPQWEEFVVRSGDNLSLIFKRAGFSNVDVYRIVNTAPQGRALERIYPGQTMAFLRDESGELAAVRHDVDALQTVTYRRMDGGFSSERDVREPETRRSVATVEIESSLFLAGKEAGLSSNLILEVANIFGGVIDFVLDPRTGDTLEVIYEELFLDGEKYQDGKVIAASYTNRGERFDAYRYVDSNGFASYYNGDGVSMKKAFLMAPVDFTRISSNFNPQRRHPIYKTVRPHNGTDYAAPRGTPVFSAGDGRVIEAGYSRANGNYVFIQHGERYITKYLHLNKRKVKTGQRVVQSQVIGTVGSTGAATGPHLHYEFLVNGVHRNPRTIHKDLPKAKSLPESEMPAFRLAIADTATRLARLREERQLAAGTGVGDSAP
jgi:murein DD-endopeptidase MepM/ murein hydrolase activator NlpD